MRECLSTLPRGEELAERLASVLEVVYLMFNEGYAATIGNDWMRPALCDEALRLGRVLAELAPHEPEVLGLLALMEIQASRIAARADRPAATGAAGRSRTEPLGSTTIQRGLAALARAEGLAQPGGPYQLQAAIAACHVRAARAEDTDWARISALYATLMQVAPSPVVELNRAVAVSMHEGPAAGLAIGDALYDDKALRQYQWLPSVRGDLLERLGRRDEARAEFEQAAALASNQREQALLLERAARLS